MQGEEEGMAPLPSLMRLGSSTGGAGAARAVLGGLARLGGVRAPALSGAGFSSAAAEGGGVSTLAEKVGATEAEARQISALSGAIMSTKSELERRAEASVKVDWSKYDPMDENMNKLKKYFETYKAPAPDKAIIANLEKKFAELDKALKEDAALAVKEIATIDEELKKLDYELVRPRARPPRPPPETSPEARGNVLGAAPSRRAR